MSSSSSLSLLIQHHPRRKGTVLNRLLATLAPSSPIVVTDPEPDARIRSAWRTYRRCLETIETDYAVILQDDTIACPGFERAARAAFAARPGRLISFYHSTTPTGNMRALRGAIDTCTPFFELQSGTWGPTVALGWPRELAHEFLAYVDGKKHMRHDRITDDPLVGEWALQGRPKPGMLATAPSLVEHPDDVYTIVGSARGGKGTPERRAACFIGDVPVDKWIELL